MTEPDDLYGLPLEQFIRERGVLVKAMRRDGDRDRAKEVQALRKPSVAAWAVNQLVRTKRKDVRALFDAGDALQHAQSELLEGRGDGQALREAVTRERETVDALSHEARGLLSSDGHELTQATLEKVGDTLHAAALDPEARDLVERGRLERELQHIGLGELGGAFGASAAPLKRAAKGTGAKRAKEAGDGAQAKERRREEKRADRECAEQLKAARQSERDARRAAERADRELHSAENRRDGAEAALRAAEDELAAARERCERTATEYESAQAEVQRFGEAH